MGNAADAAGCQPGHTHTVTMEGDRGRTPPHLPAFESKPVPAPSWSSQVSIIWLLLPPIAMATRALVARPPLSSTEAPPGCDSPTRGSASCSSRGLKAWPDLRTLAEV